MQKYLSVFVIILSKKPNMWLSKGMNLEAKNKVPEKQHSHLMSLKIEIIIAVDQELSGN